MLGLSIGGFATYGLGQWIPAFFVRNHHLTLTQVGVVITAEGNPKVAAAMAAHGIEVHTYPATEIGVNGSGGPTCMTRPILRA